MKRFLGVLLCAVMLCAFTGCSAVWFPFAQWFPFTQATESPEVAPAEQFEITASDGTVLLTQDDLEKADAMWYSMNSDEEAIPIIQLTFTDGGTKKFADATTMYIGQELPILLDGEEIMRPTVNERITDGVIIISGDNITYEKAVELAARINSTKE